MSNTKSLNEFKEQYSKLLTEFVRTVKVPYYDDSIKIADAALYELQHAIVHLIHTLGDMHRDAKFKHYEKACEHLDRGIVDTWKLLIFDENLIKNKIDRQDTIFFKQLLDTRITEFKEVKTPSPQGDKPITRETYKEFYIRCNSKPLPEYVHVKSELPVITEEQINALHNWIKFELVYTSLRGKKDLDILKELLKHIAYAPSSTTIDNSTGNIALKIIDICDKLGVLNSLGSDDKRNEAIIKATEEYNKNDNASPYIKVCKKYFLSPLGFDLDSF